MTACKHCGKRIGKRKDGTYYHIYPRDWIVCPSPEKKAEPSEE